MSRMDKRNEMNKKRVLTPLKMAGWMMVVGFLFKFINVVFIPLGMLVGFILSFIYYIIVKGE